MSVPLSLRGLARPLLRLLRLRLLLGHALDGDHPLIEQLLDLGIAVHLDVGELGRRLAGRQPYRAASVQVDHDRPCGQAADDLGHVESSYNCSGRSLARMRSTMARAESSPTGTRCGRIS